MSKEIWKDVKGYEGIYQVSSKGRVKRLVGYQCCVERVLKPGKRWDGYLQVGLYRDGNRTNKLVHRLVAEAFLPRPPGCNEVNHRNGIRDDNRVENLEWVTAAENYRHAIDVLGNRQPHPKGEQHGFSKLTRGNVKKIRKLFSTGDHTQPELAEMFDVSVATISRVVRRKTWRHVP